MQLTNLRTPVERKRSIHLDVITSNMALLKTSGRRLKSSRHRFQNPARFLTILKYLNRTGSLSMITTQVPATVSPSTSTRAKSAVSSIEPHRSRSSRVYRRRGKDCQDSRQIQNTNYTLFGRDEPGGKFQSRTCDCATLGRVISGTRFTAPSWRNVRRYVWDGQDPRDPRYLFLGRNLFIA